MCFRENIRNGKRPFRPFPDTAEIHIRSNLDILRAVCLWRRALYCWLTLWKCDRNSCTLLVVNWIYETNISIVISITLRIMYAGMNTATRVHTCAHLLLFTELQAVRILPPLPTKCSRHHQKNAFFAPDMAPSLSPSVATYSNANIKAPKCFCEIVYRTRNRQSNQTGSPLLLLYVAALFWLPYTLVQYIQHISWYLRALCITFGVGIRKDTP